MHYLSAHIIIGRWTFKSIAEVAIEETFDTLTDTCDIGIPKNIKWQGNLVSGADKPINRGDTVVVQLGYNDRHATVFDGYVRTVLFEDKLTIKCEDPMFALKSAEVKKQVVKGSLGKILKALLPASVTLINIPDHNSYIGAHRFTEATVAKELEVLKKDYGVKVFFQNNRLFCGWLRPQNQKPPHRFIWGKNIIESSLAYTEAADRLIKINATSLNDKGKHIKITVGDKGGEERSFFAANSSKERLKEKALRFYDKLKLPKYEGNFTTFGEPVVQKGDRVFIKGRDGHEGTYLVKSVKKTFGNGGYRQEIELDYQIGHSPSK